MIQLYYIALVTVVSTNLTFNAETEKFELDSLPKLKQELNVSDWHTFLRKSQCLTYLGEKIENDLLSEHNVGLGHLTKFSKNGWRASVINEEEKTLTKLKLQKNSDHISASIHYHDVEKFSVKQLEIRAECKQIRTADPKPIN